MLEAMLRSAIHTLWPVALAVVIAALLEWLIPWRRGVVDRLRWLHASILYLFSIVIAYLIVPLGSAGVALLAAERGWGLLNALTLPAWISITLGVFMLDFTQWACHWMLHHSPLLWRLHRLHHSDEMLDASTAFRFHPAETIARFLLQAAMILAFGVPVLAVAISAVATLIFDVWEHANARSHRALGRLSAIFITPDLHRLHHSTKLRHQNGNLGTIFSLWDRLFGTFIEPAELDEKVAFGLGSKSRLGFKTLAALLIDPFRKA